MIAYKALGLALAHKHYVNMSYDYYCIFKIKSHFLEFQIGYLASAIMGLKKGTRIPRDILAKIWICNHFGLVYSRGFSSV